jgi:hypothetical protein
MPHTKDSNPLISMLYLMISMEDDGPARTRTWDQGICRPSQSHGSHSASRTVLGIFHLYSYIEISVKIDQESKYFITAY